MFAEVTARIVYAKARIETTGFYNTCPFFSVMTALRPWNTCRVDCHKMLACLANTFNLAYSAGFFKWSIWASLELDLEPKICSGVNRPLVATGLPAELV